jgi:hypothetical protein
MWRGSWVGPLRPNWTWSGAFEFANEVVEIVVELLRLPGVDASHGRFCKTNAICNTFVYSMDAGEDVASCGRTMMGNLRAVPSRGRGVITPLESVFRELDALGDVVIHPIYPGDQIVRVVQWAGNCPDATCVTSN